MPAVTVRGQISAAAMTVLSGEQMAALAEGEKRRGGYFTGRIKKAEQIARGLFLFFFLPPL